MLTFAAIAALAALGLAAAGPSFGIKRGTAVIPASIAAIAFLLSCVTMIEAKNAGVVTTFGKPTASLEPGMHFKAPWQKVTELDGTKKTDKYESTACLPVRIGDGTMACASTSIRWSIVGSKAAQIFGDYRSDDVNENVRTSLVEVIYKNAVSAVMGGYNPTAEIRVVDPEDVNTNAEFVPDYDGLAAQIAESMEKRVAAEGGYINVETITVSDIRLSETTQGKIDDFQAEVAKTQVALQAQQTAAAQASANKALSASISNDPNVLVAKCLDTVQMIAEENLVGILPAGYSCWNGGGSAVVVPSAPAAAPAQ